MSKTKWVKTRIPGIYVVNGIYHLKKSYLGVSISATTGVAQGKGKLGDAAAILDKKMADIRQMTLMGVRQQVPFMRAAAQYCADHQHLKQIRSYEQFCERLCLYVGEVPVELIHQRHQDVQRLVDDLRAGTPLWGHGRFHGGVSRPRKKATIMSYLSIIGRVLRYAANEWRDDNNMPYLLSAPRFSIDDIAEDVRRPHAITWEQQRILLPLLAPHQQRMYLFCVNTGLRDNELCNLAWAWIRKIEGVGTICVVPGEYVKGRGKQADRVVPLNRICESVLEDCRGHHATAVFTFGGNPITRLLNSGWKRARSAAHDIDPTIPQDLHVHDMRHTFGHRLETAGVDAKDMQALLGHRAGDITSHYSQEDLIHLAKCVQKIAKATKSVPILSVTPGRR